MGKALYLDCTEGVAGESLLGALLDLGCPVETILQGVSSVPLLTVPWQAVQLRAGGAAGLHIQFADDILDDHVSMPEIIYALQALSLSPWARQKIEVVVQNWLHAEAEGQDNPVEKLVFLRRDAVRALLCIIGVIVVCETLSITHIYASVLPLTPGLYEDDRGGKHLNMSPVVLKLLEHTEVSWKVRDVEQQVVTAVGAALLATLAAFTRPTFTMQRSGGGFAYSRNGYRHCVHAYMGLLKEEEEGREAPEQNGWEHDTVAVLETHIDNMSGELVGDLMERLLKLGALDVSFLPLQMKKNRPATLLTVICKAGEGEHFAGILLRETTTLGVRIQQVQRVKARREARQIETPLGPMLIKLKCKGEDIISAAPEYEECLRLARLHNLALIDVYEVAHRAIQSAIF